MKVFAWWPPRAASAPEMAAPAALAACPGPRPPRYAAWRVALAFLMANQVKQTRVVGDARGTISLTILNFFALWASFCVDAARCMLPEPGSEVSEEYWMKLSCGSPP